MSLLNTDEIRNMLRAQTGTVPVADFGLVHQGRIGYSNCSVSVGIEQWQGMYFVWVSIVHQKNRAGRDTRILKWAYSQTSPTDLAAVLADLEIVEHAEHSVKLVDTRGCFARGFDRLIRSEYLGEYQFTSPLHGPNYSGRVEAWISRSAGQVEVSLLAYGHAKSGVAIQSRVPLAACASIRKALLTYSQQPS